MGPVGVAHSDTEICCARTRSRWADLESRTVAGALSNPAELWRHPEYRRVTGPASRRWTEQDHYALRRDAAREVPEEPKEAACPVWR
ncbi:hypothetical protein GCM10009836_69930 [Pseudonocardia ailaonensis]|uniref:Uncharacterized protein n=1 Tax=Pseudonocardia ailaonensis TaxID=367279 RepID=A0ABN2NNW5_9PSEU